MAPHEPGPPELTVGDTLRRLGALLRPRRVPVALGCLGLILAGAVGLTQPLAARWVLEDLGRGESVTWALVALTGLVVVSALLLGAGNFLLLRAAEDVVLDGRRALVRHLLLLTVPGLHRHAPGDLLSRVTADTTLLRQIAIQSVTQALLGVVMLVGALILMGTVDLFLLGTVIGVVVLLAAVIGVVMPRIRAAARDAQRSVGAMGSEVERILGAFTTVKASGAEAQELQRAGDAAQRARDQGTVLARWSAVAGTSAGLSIQVAFLIVLGVGGARAASGAISVATLVAFLLYVFYLTQPVLQLVNASTYFQAGRAALGRIGEITALPTEPLDLDGRAPEPIGHGPAEVRFENVVFAYPGRDVAALAGVSLDVRPGTLTALVGPSGAGKSTMLALLERFYDPTGGRILLDGRSLEQWDLAALRATIAYVEQDAPVMAGTLRENLAYAAPGVSDDALRTVLQRTRLEPLLHRLGNDLDAEILHRGVSLSGGERQRVAIARALLRRPRLLLLDEATSQLDAGNEAALKEIVEDLAGETTVLAIAHRLSTVRAADQLAVLEDGRLRAVGDHAQLLDEDALYARFAAGQLAAA
ncbi:MAG: ABC transporter ATP-binding protein [Solirubrobacteraceae bacterium]|nr:ABC transporter ATP-binding protein [Solirubrobacteraceae bacterium]